MKILGAGMSGCLAAIAFPQATIIEKQPKDEVASHNAILRFRSDAVSRITGIPFKKVTVRKAIYYKGKFVDPTVRYANMYSMKVTGQILDRSIWNLDTVERYIAPYDFHNALLTMLGKRVYYEDSITSMKEFQKDETVISTVPMNTIIQIVDIEFGPLNFNFQNIHTARYKIDDCDVHQTVYLPDDDLTVYRATITGNNMIIESKNKISGRDLQYVSDAFYLFPHLHSINIISEGEQKFGKIAPINEHTRKYIIHKLSTDYGIYSLGRFAIWKNILLDDVVKDIDVIRRMINEDEYGRRLNES